MVISWMTAFAECTRSVKVLLCFQSTVFTVNSFRIRLDFSERGGKSVPEIIAKLLIQSLYGHVSSIKLLQITLQNHQLRKVVVSGAFGSKDFSFTSVELLFHMLDQGLSSESAFA